MYIARPATKSNALFDEVAEWAMSEDDIDAITFKRLKRDAEALPKDEGGTRDIIFSALAALHWDVEACLAHVKRAFEQEYAVSVLMNGAVSFDLLNRPDLAAEHARIAYEMAPNDFELVNQASAYLIASGSTAEAARIQRACDVPQGKIFELDAVEIMAVQRFNQVDDESLFKELFLAHDVLSARKIRTRQMNVEYGKEPDGAGYLIYTLCFIGELDVEFQLEEEFALRLDEIPSWDPRKLTVQFSAVTSDALQAA